LLFYVVSILLIGINVPWDYPGLSNKSTTTSPFTIVFKMAGSNGAASIMNTVILSSVLSAGNHALFAGTRVLYGLASTKLPVPLSEEEDGDFYDSNGAIVNNNSNSRCNSSAMEGRKHRSLAPAIFARTTEGGVPLPALLATSSVSALCFGSSFIGGGVLWGWLQNIVGVSNQIAWFSIGLASWRFRRAWVEQGRSVEEMKFRAGWTWGWGPPFVVVSVGCLILIQGWSSLFPVFSPVDFVSFYMEIPIMLAMYFVWQWSGPSSPSSTTSGGPTEPLLGRGERETDSPDSSIHDLPRSRSRGASGMGERRLSIGSGSLGRRRASSYSYGAIDAVITKRKGVKSPSPAAGATGAVGRWIAADWVDTRTVDLFEQEYDEAEDEQRDEDEDGKGDEDVVRENRLSGRMGLIWGVYYWIV
jgi:hypothetical protein